MKSGPLTLEARVTPEVFREFAFFDTFRRQKRWRGPALFALMMGGFAAVCFALRESREQAVLIGTVLLVVGLGLPAAYIELRAVLLLVGAPQGEGAEGGGLPGSLPAPAGGGGPACVPGGEGGALPLGGDGGGLAAQAVPVCLCGGAPGLSAPPAGRGGGGTALGVPHRPSVRKNLGLRFFRRQVAILHKKGRAICVLSLIAF